MARPLLAAETPASVTIAGTIHQTGIASNCYQLIAANGTKYELIGDFPRTDGAKVRVTGTLPTDLMTLCQVGRPLEVKSIKRTSLFFIPWFSKS